MAKQSNTDEENKKLKEQIELLKKRLELQQESFDFYKNLPDSLSEPTLTGAWVSIVLMSILGVLLFQSTYNFIQFQK
jgi:hypothetical protein